MLKNNKLLYVFPEMAFTAKVAETPKEDYYFVQAFHQINGDFMKDENLLFENLKKLFERIEEGTYTLVLPDFLFTDTIVNVPEIEDLKIAEHLRDQLLPRIEVSTFSHDTRTSILLQRKDNSKVQLSAFEKELIATIKLAIGNKEIKIDEIVPLSWILKAAVSLEPSLTIAQMGERLYLAEHYIGINQTVNAKLTDLEIIAETVKTLKGADPNLQTAYLLTSGLVEERLKKILLKTLPVQQLTEQNEEEAKVPSYLRQIIEVGARTLSLADFPVPRFDLVVEETKAVPAEVTKTEQVMTEAITEELTASGNQDKAGSVSEKKEAVISSINRDSVVNEDKLKEVNSSPGEELKKDLVGQVNTDQEAEVKKDSIEQLETSRFEENTSRLKPATAVFLPKKIVAEVVPEVAAAQIISEQISVSEEQSSVAQETVVDESKSSSTTVETQKIQEKVAEQEKTEVSPSVKSTTEIKTDAAVTEKAPNKKFALSFMNKDKKVTESKTEIAKTAEKKIENNDKITDTNLVTKKKGRMGMFFKKLFLFILIFAITIIVGIVVGIGILLLSGKDVLKSEVSPTPEPTFLPTPEPIAEIPVATESTQPASSNEEEEEEASTPEEGDTEEVAIDKQKVLVVNATGVAGLAGKVKTALEKEGFKGVQTGNAKGKYEDAGTFVLMKERNSALIKVLEKGSDKTLIYDEDYQTEDAAGTYDAVIVLNEE